MNQMRSTVDPFTIEVIRDSLQALCDEMFAVMRKAAMSPLIYEVLDFGVGVTDGTGDLACQGCGIPVFVGALDQDVKAVIAKHSASNSNPIQTGDIFIGNDPYSGGTHLNDVSLMMPILARGELVGWLANKAHWSDIGGMIPGGLSTRSTSLFQEGTQFPNIKLFSRGEVIQPVLDLIVANSRMPERTLGDMWAGVAALRAGERRFNKLLEQYGTSTVRRAIASILDYGETVTRNAFDSLPRGTFTAEVLMDDAAEDGSPVPVHAKVEITDTNFIVDLTGNPKQSAAGPFNCSEAMTRIAVQIAFKALTSPSSPANAGSFRALKVICEPGTIFAAQRPAAVGLYPEPVIHAIDLVCKALAPHMPERIGAGCYASVNGTFVSGTNPVTGRFLVTIEPEPGGWGACASADGESAQFSPINGETYNIPVEVNEALYGYRVNRLELNDHSSGHGKFRGGKGIILEYVNQSKDATIGAIYTRSRYGAWGMAGGGEGSTNYVEVVRKGAVQRFAKASEIQLEMDDLIRVVTGNGGGYGDPRERPRERVADDLRNGYISAADAAEIYGLGEKQFSAAWPALGQGR